MAALHSALNLSDPVRDGCPVHRSSFFFRIVDAKIGCLAVDFNARHPLAIYGSDPSLTRNRFTADFRAFEHSNGSCGKCATAANLRELFSVFWRKWLTEFRCSHLLSSFRRIDLAFLREPHVLDSLRRMLPAFYAEMRRADLRTRLWRLLSTAVGRSYFLSCLGRNMLAQLCGSDPLNNFRRQQPRIQPSSSGTTRTSVVASGNLGTTEGHIVPFEIERGLGRVSLRNHLNLKSVCALLRHGFVERRYATSAVRRSGFVLCPTCRDGLSGQTNVRHPSNTGRDLVDQPFADYGSVSHRQVTILRAVKDSLSATNGSESCFYSRSLIAHQGSAV